MINSKLSNKAICIVLSKSCEPLYKTSFSVKIKTLLSPNYKGRKASVGGNSGDSEEMKYFLACHSTELELIRY